MIQDDPAPSRALKVVICCDEVQGIRTQDLPAWGLYKKLKENGLKPWLAKEDVEGGQRRWRETERAIRASDVILICLSEHSADRDGFLQKQINLALEVADEKQEGAIYLIPVRFEECTIPDRLGTRQWVDLFEKDGYQRLMRAFLVRAAEIRVTLEPEERQEVQQYQQAQEMPRDIARIHNDLGNEYRSRQRYQEAEQQFRQALVVDAENAYASNQLADIYKIHQLYRAAEKQYLRTLEIEPDNAYTHSNLGAIYLAQERYGDAEPQLLRTLKIDPNNAYASNNLGRIYYLQQRFEKAEDQFRRTLEIEPGNAYAQNQLGHVYSSLKRYNDAVNAFKRAVQLEPGNASYRRDRDAGIGDAKR